MALQGWYPDPSGQPGRYRYWDGTGWSTATTTNPNSAPPSITNVGNGNQRKRDRAWLYALIGLLVVTLAAVIFILARGNAPSKTPATADSNSAKPTVSGWDETSKPSTPPPPSVGGEMVACPSTNLFANTRQPSGRVAAGALSFQRSSNGGVYSGGFNMAYDVHEQQRLVGNTEYFSSTAVGRLAISDGYVDIAVAAQQVMMCHSNYRHDSDAPTDVLIAGEPIEISGRPAWHIQWQNNYIGRSLDGEILDVIIVDLGSDKDYLGMFYSCRPIGYADFERSIAATIASLRVDG
ncbi:MAG: DUF2510 domain-containing protein [Propionibacteriaceae bacterium]|nr:DUF2510 domain-containing protein [Propionibacteriaceae bacterium]